MRKKLIITLCLIIGLICFCGCEKKQIKKEQENSKSNTYINQNDKVSVETGGFFEEVKYKETLNGYIKKENALKIRKKLEKLANKELNYLKSNDTETIDKAVHIDKKLKENIKNAQIVEHKRELLGFYVVNKNSMSLSYVSHYSYVDPEGLEHKFMGFFRFDYTKNKKSYEIKSVDGDRFYDESVYKIGRAKNGEIAFYPINMKQKLDEIKNSSKEEYGYEE